MMKTDKQCTHCVNTLYKIGDVIAAMIKDFTIYGKSFKHYVRGTIVGIYKKNQLKGYDVKLFGPEEFEQYVPTPLTEKYKCEYDATNVLSNNKHKMEIIFINHQDIIRHCPAGKISKMSFRKGLKEIWSKLVFRKVKAVIRQPKDLINIEYVYINDSGIISIKEYPNLKDAFSEIPKKFHRNIRGQYKDYYGFTTATVLRENDQYQGREIFFSKKCYSELNLGTQPTAKFCKSRSEKTWPPRKDRIICGLVEEGEKGLFYRRWFVCSRQFLTLWTMIMYNDHKSFYNSENKKKSFDKMLLELDTGPLRSNPNLQNTEKQSQYKIFNVEYSALQWDDRYIEVANLAFKNPAANIPNQKTNNLDYNKNLSFSQKIYNNVLWMLH